MKTFATLIALAALAMSSAASAQDDLGDWYVAPSIVYTDDDIAREVDDGVTGIQVSVGRTLSEHLSVEGLLGYHDMSGWEPPGLPSPDQTLFDVSANLLFYLNRDWRVSPYFLVGLGYLSADVDGIGRDSNASGSLGAGFTWRMGQSNFSLRSELRARMVNGSEANQFGDENNMTDTLFSIGFQYNYGAKRSVAPPPPGTDSDADGVLDMWDECPDTPRGTQVGSSGCPLLVRDADADGDRVPDRLDECPNTPVGAAVNRVGCELDSDRDGVPTGSDRCPSSRPGADVDIYGCEDDRDGDGIVDHKDSCPDSRRGVRVDIYGCEISDIIRLPGVNFETGHDVLLAGTEHVLQNAAATLNRYPELQIEVAGHTDDVGPGDTNYSLSERRAKTVRDYLIRYGVDESRVIAVGYGESQPIADNATAQGRATNRRVELRIVN